MHACMDLAHNAKILLEILNRIMQRIMSICNTTALPQSCSLYIWCLKQNSGKLAREMCSILKSNANQLANIANIGNIDISYVALKLCTS